MRDYNTIKDLVWVELKKGKSSVRYRYAVPGFIRLTILVIAQFLSVENLDKNNN